MDPYSNRGVCMGHSADGLHWNHYNNGIPVIGPPNDTLNQIVWDEEARLYRFYGRQD